MYKEMTCFKCTKGSDLRWDVCWHQSLDLWRQCRRMEATRTHAPLAALSSFSRHEQADPVCTVKLVFSCSSLFYVVPILLYRQLWVFLLMPQHGMHHPFFRIRASSFTKSSSATGKNNLHYGPHHSFTSQLQNLEWLEGYKRKIFTRKGVSKHDFLSQGASHAALTLTAKKTFLTCLWLALIDFKTIAVKL